jgi:hypothetical protein
MSPLGLQTKGAGFWFGIISGSYFLVAGVMISLILAAVS